MCDDKSVKSCKCNKRFNDSIGHEIKVLNQVLQRKLIYSAKDKGVDKLTLMHGWIIAYLYDHRDEDVYQKDIEKFFGLKKSTITSILNSLEDAGYIERKVGKDDGRLRRIVLTEKGFAMNEKVHNEFETLEENMSNLFSEDEYNNLIASLEKIRNYLEGKDD